MNLLKRAGLYTLRSRGRTLLLFAVLLLAATFVLSGLSAMEASENTSAKLRGTTGASFTVERNLSTGSMNSMGGGMSVIQQEFVTDAMLDEIRKVEGIKGYTAKEIGYYNLTDLSGNPYRMIYDTSLWDDTDLDYQANVIGSFFTEYDELFLSQAFQLTQGRHITDQDEDGIIISEDLAEKHGLSLGDRVLIYRPDWVTGAVNAGDKSVEAEIVGMFRILASQEDQSSMAPYNIYENYIFAPMCVTKSLIDWVDDEAEREGYEYADFHHWGRWRASAVDTVAGGIWCVLAAIVAVKLLLFLFEYVAQLVDHIFGQQDPRGAAQGIACNVLHSVSESALEEAPLLPHEAYEIALADAFVSVDLALWQRCGEHGQAVAPLAVQAFHCADPLARISSRGEVLDEDLVADVVVVAARHGKRKVYVVPVETREGLLVE